MSVPVAKSNRNLSPWFGSQSRFLSTRRDFVCVCGVYLGEFMCILDRTIMIYNTCLLHVYIDNMYF